MTARTDPTPPGPVTLGLGAAAAIASSPTATVLAAFDKAVYLRFATGVAAVTAASVPLGPLHVRAPIERGRLGPGQVFTVPASWRGDAIVWRGELPDPATFGPGRTAPPAWLAPLADLAARSALLRPPLVARWQAATASGGLDAMCRVLGGLGPGLTPSGDDALAGLLLAERIRNPDAEDELVALAAGVATHEISRAFLIWAARGQSIKPVHRLLTGRGEAGGPGAVAAHAAAQLLEFGHTSGADLALGLWYGANVASRHFVPNSLDLARKGARTP